MEKYLTSDIIFGTREKLLELRNKLLLLEELTIAKNRRDVKKVSYKIVPNHNGREMNDNQIFICDLLDNRSLIQDISDFLKSGYLYSPIIGIGDSAELEIDDNGDYRFKNSEFNQSIHIADQNRFKEIIKEIKESDVYNEMEYKKIYNDEKKKSNNYIKLSQSGIYISNALKAKESGQLIYNPEFDLITACVVSGMFLRKVNPQDLKDLLNVEVESSLLSDYQRSLIDSNEVAKKKIVIDDCHEKIAYFSIEEDPDSIHLVKRKRKSLYI